MADKNIKILIADDSQFMRKVLAKVLNDAGYNNLIECEDGLECLKAFRSENPSLVLLDVIMPNLNGLEVLKQIGNTANVIIISALGQEQIIKEAKENGAKDYINKPFLPDEVLIKVNQIVSAI